MTFLSLSAGIYIGAFTIIWLLCLPRLIIEYRELRKLRNINRIKKDFFKDIHKD